PARWWRMQGSNLRPLACKASALPAELILQIDIIFLCISAWQRPTLTEGNPQLPSALESLTAVFGMGTGVTFLPLPPDQYLIFSLFKSEPLLKDNFYYRLIHLKMQALF